MRVERGPDRSITVEARTYRLQIDAAGRLATLLDAEGDRWATLRLLSAVDATDAVDETLGIDPPEVVEGPGSTTVVVRRRSTRWEEASLRLELGEHEIGISAYVRGQGRIRTIHLPAGRTVGPGPMGFLPSGRDFHYLLSPNPADPARLVQPAEEQLGFGVVADAEPGRGRWFFTPSPLFLAVTFGDPATKWLGLAVTAPVAELTMTSVRYVPVDGAFAFAFDYEGHTAVDGEFRLPSLLITPGLADPYDGLRRHRFALLLRGDVPGVPDEDDPDWWTEPIFCGWGAQSHLAAVHGVPTADACTQVNYDGFLSALAAENIVPPTIVIDDKWERTYGSGQPDEAKWPDLRGWIRKKQRAGHRVVLWWKAWDASGVPPDGCVRTPDGTPVAIDPTSPVGRRHLEQAITRVVSPDGLGADGLKIDFTARTPSGESLRAAGPLWGIALLHELLSVVYTAAKAARPDALVITQTPHPGFIDVTDMIRLNDMLRLDDAHQPESAVPQMRQRAAVVSAVVPEKPIDTDDWCALNRADWREYLAVKPYLGVPALYYATHIDRTGEPLRPEDYAAIRDAWSVWSG